MCKHCADSCLNEKNVEMMVSCIRLNCDCAKACEIAAEMLIRNSAFAKEAVELCRKVCAACADECDKHENEHCKECAQMCRECEKLCDKYLS
jgi:hypothetical protein